LCIYSVEGQLFRT